MPGLFGDAGSIGENGDELAGLSAAFQQSRQLAQHLAIGLLGRLQLAQRPDRALQLPTTFEQVRRLDEARSARLRVELPVAAANQNRRQRRLVARTAIEPLERRQGVVVFRVAFEHHAIQALRCSPIARGGVQPGRPQRELPRRVWLGIRQRRLDLRRTGTGNVRGGGDALDVVEHRSWHRVLAERTPERVQGPIGRPELLGRHVGDLAQPMDALRTVVLHRHPPLVKRDELLVITTRCGQRLEHVERPFARISPFEQPSHRGPSARVGGIAFQRIAEGRQGAFGIVEGAQPQLTEGRQEIRLSCGVRRELCLAGQHFGKLRMLPLPSQHAFERSQHVQVVARQRARLPQEVRSAIQAAGGAAELRLVERGQSQGQRELEARVEGGVHPLLVHVGQALPVAGGGGETFQRGPRRGVGGILGEGARPDRERLLRPLPVLLLDARHLAEEGDPASGIVLDRQSQLGQLDHACPRPRQPQHRLENRDRGQTVIIAARHGEQRLQRGQVLRRARQNGLVAPDGRFGVAELHLHHPGGPEGELVAGGRTRIPPRRGRR